jgi:hypothetical protein
LRFRGLTTAVTALALIAAPTAAVSADWRSSSPELDEGDQIELIWAAGAVVLLLVVVLAVFKNDKEEVTPPPVPKSP